MKACPCCGRTFNIFQRAVGEAKEHVRQCRRQAEKKDPAHLAGICRGCPAGCFEKVDFGEDQGSRVDK